MKTDNSLDDILKPIGAFVLGAPLVAALIINLEAI